MKSDQAHLLLLIAVTSGVSVFAVILSALLSVFIVQVVKSFFFVVVQLISFVLEVIVALVAAITSGKHRRSHVVAVVLGGKLICAWMIDGRVYIHSLTDEAVSYAGNISNFPWTERNCGKGEGGEYLYCSC